MSLTDVQEVSLGRLGKINWQIDDVYECQQSIADAVRHLNYIASTLDKMSTGEGYPSSIRRDDGELDRDASVSTIRHSVISGFLTDLPNRWEKVNTNFESLKARQSAFTQAFQSAWDEVAKPIPPPSTV